MIFKLIFILVWPLFLTNIYAQNTPSDLNGKYSHWYAHAGAVGDGMLYFTCSGSNTSERPADAITNGIGSTIMTSAEMKADHQKIQSVVSGQIAVQAHIDQGIQHTVLDEQVKDQQKTYQILSELSQKTEQGTTFYNISVIQAQQMAIEVDRSAQDCRNSITTDSLLIHEKLRQNRILYKEHSLDILLLALKNIRSKINNNIDYLASHDDPTDLFNKALNQRSLIKSQQTPEWFRRGQISLATETKFLWICQKSLESSYALLAKDILKMGETSIDRVHNHLALLKQSFMLISEGCRPLEQFQIPPAPQSAQICNTYINKVLNSYLQCPDRSHISGEDYKAHMTNATLVTGYLDPDRTDSFGRGIIYDVFSKNSQIQLTHYTDETLKAFERVNQIPVIDPSKSSSYVPISIDYYYIFLIHLSKLFINTAYAAPNNTIFPNGAKVPCLAGQSRNGQCLSVINAYEKFNQLFESNSRMKKINLIVGDIGNRIQSKESWDPKAKVLIDQLLKEKKFINAHKEEVSKVFHNHFFSSATSRQETKDQWLASYRKIFPQETNSVNRKSFKNDLKKSGKIKKIDTSYTTKSHLNTILELPMNNPENSDQEEIQSKPVKLQYDSQGRINPDSLGIKIDYILSPSAKNGPTLFEIISKRYQSQILNKTLIPDENQ